MSSQGGTYEVVQTFLTCELAKTTDQQKANFEKMYTVTKYATNSLVMKKADGQSKYLPHLYADFVEYAYCTGDSTFKNRKKHFKDFQKDFSAQKDSFENMCSELTAILKEDVINIIELERLSLFFGQPMQVLVNYYKENDNELFFGIVRELVLEGSFASNVMEAVHCMLIKLNDNAPLDETEFLSYLDFFGVVDDEQECKIFELVEATSPCDVPQSINSNPCNAQAIRAMGNNSLPYASDQHLLRDLKCYDYPLGNIHISDLALLLCNEAKRIRDDTTNKKREIAPEIYIYINSNYTRYAVFSKGGILYSYGKIWNPKFPKYTDLQGLFGDKVAKMRLIKLYREFKVKSKIYSAEEIQEKNIASNGTSNSSSQSTFKDYEAVKLHLDANVAVKLNGNNNNENCALLMKTTDKVVHHVLKHPTVTLNPKNIDVDHILQEFFKEIRKRILKCREENYSGSEWTVKQGGKIHIAYKCRNCFSKLEIDEIDRPLLITSY